MAQDLTKEEKIATVRKIHKEVIDSLGEHAKNYSKKYIALSVWEKLPEQKIYDPNTVAQILNGHYS